MRMAEEWHPVAETADIDDEDLIAVDLDGRILAVYNCGGAFYATDGICTHEDACLADGLVMDGVIECPMHQGRFEIATGKALGAPVSVDLKTYPARQENGRVYVLIGRAAG
jgi:3-phenylpropionate/trans-cinnamate dioxygenase ferredoxin subunit